MKHSRTLILSAAAAILLALFAAPALARGKHGKHGKHGEMGLLNPKMVERVAGELGLDPQTTERIKERVFAAREAAIPLKADLEAARLKMHQLLQADDPAQAEVMRQIEVVGQKEVALQKHKVGTMLEIRGMLTPAQRQQLGQLRGKFKDERKKYRKGRKGHRGPPDDAPGADDSPEE